MHMSPQRGFSLCCRDELYVITPFHLPSPLSSSSLQTAETCRQIKRNADLLGVRNRQVLADDFSLPLPPPLTNSTNGCGLGQLLTFILSPLLPPHPFLHLFLHSLLPQSLLFHFCHPYFFNMHSLVPSLFSLPATFIF